MENNSVQNSQGSQNSAQNQGMPTSGNPAYPQGSVNMAPANNAGQMNQQGMPQGGFNASPNMPQYGYQPNPANAGQNGMPYNGQPYQQQPFQQPMQQPQQYQQMPPQVQGQPNGNEGNEANSATQDQKPDGKHAAHAKKAQSAFIQRSAKMRKLYVVIIILLVIAVVAIGFLAARMIWTADNSASQQTQITSTDLTEAGEGDDAKDSDTPKTTVPNLVQLLGHTRKQAVEMIGHGAEVVSNRKVKEEGNPVRREVRIELTDEPADSRSGAPTVYLSLNKSGKVIIAGYSVAISSLGYGSASFGDTVESEHIVENTLGEAGLNVELGSAVLPEDSTKYSSYSSDGSTVTKEYYSFSGKGSANGKKYDWEAMLSYDYTVANASENLNDTLRTIFIYVS